MHLYALLICLCYWFLTPFLPQSLHTHIYVRELKLSWRHWQYENHRFCKNCRLQSNQSLIGSCNYISACDVAGINLAYAEVIDHEPSIECDSTCWCNIHLHSLGETFGEDLYANIESCGHGEVLSTWAPTSISEPPSPVLLPPPPPPPGLSSGDMNYSDLSMGKCFYSAILSGDTLEFTFLSKIRPGWDLILVAFAQRYICCDWSSRAD